MAQAEFHIFDGGLFEDLQLTLVTIVSAERNFSTSHAHGQILSALLSSVDGKSGPFCKVGSRHASLRRPTSVGWVERSHFGWRSVWSAPGGSRSFLLWRTQSLCVTENYKTEHTNPTWGYWKIPFRITAEVAIIDIVLAEKKEICFWDPVDILAEYAAPLCFGISPHYVSVQSKAVLLLFTPLMAYVWRQQAVLSSQKAPDSYCTLYAMHQRLDSHGLTVAGEDVEHLAATECMCLNPWVAFYS